MYYYVYSDELYHHGIKGQKWGVRRYQNEDGSVTSAGAKRYYGGNEAVKTAKSNYKQAKKEYNKSFNNYYNKSLAAWSPSKKHREANNQRFNDALEKAKKMNEAKTAYKQAKVSDKFERKIAKSKANDDKIMAARAKNRDRLSNKWEKKISKGKMTRETANKRLSDFDNGTKAVAAGNRHYNQVLSNYSKMKVASLSDKNVKNSKEYKAAAKAYMSQKYSDMFSNGGSTYTKLSYAMDEAKKRNN